MRLTVVPDLAQLRLVPAFGTRRRLEALAATGWPVQELEARLGSPGAFRRVRGQETVLWETAHAVSCLYDELWDQAPPETVASRRVKARAVREGWARPADWDDEWIDLPPAALQIALAREVSWMDHEELRVCDRARFRDGDRSPLTMAASREFQRRKAVQARSRARLARLAQAS